MVSKRQVITRYFDESMLLNINSTQFNLTFYKNIKVFFSISTSFFLKDFDWKSYTQSFCKALFLKLINRGTLTILIARIASWDTWSAARCTPNEWRAAKRCGSVRHRLESRKSLLLLIYLLWLLHREFPVKNLYFPCKGLQWNSKIYHVLCQGWFIRKPAGNLRLWWFRASIRILY